jgi:ComF family protein
MKRCLSDYIRTFISIFIYPQLCLICGLPSTSGFPLCGTCLESHLLTIARSVSFVNPDVLRCIKCGRTLISSLELCTVCRNTPLLTAIDRIVPLFSYTTFGQELLTTWKISGMRGLSLPFARCLFTALEIVCGEESVSVVPVPPRPGKIRDKGWDQIEDLASLLSGSFGIKVQKCLVRTSRIQQKKLDRQARHLNLKGYIRTIEGVSIPEIVVLLDDLMTTGATLDSCAEALKIAGCRKVYGLTLFFD